MDHPNGLKKLAGGADGELWYFDVDEVIRAHGGQPGRFPKTIRILLEQLVRHQGRHPAFTPAALERLLAWQAAGGEAEFPFLPARVLLQDFTGVPCVADLAALRGAVARRGGHPREVDPVIPADLVIDHSVQLDETACPAAAARNAALEIARNRERYTFLRWGQHAFAHLTVHPPGLGICHQVNMERLAQGIRRETCGGRTIAFPDTVIGTDSHTVMINSMGILGWGVGGIEAEAALLGQPIPLSLPAVIGVRLTGRLRHPANATDLALTVTERLRKRGVVNCFVEFFGPGLASLSLADRAPSANMAPEYGATMGWFPVDEATLDYYRLTGRSEAQVRLIEAYARAQGLWHDPAAPLPDYADVLELDLDRVEPSVAGPHRPQERAPLSRVPQDFRAAFPHAAATAPAAPAPAAPGAPALADGDVVLASITSCTNTSNPSLMITAALVARAAAERGLTVPPRVRTSFAPGSRVVVDYLRRADLLAPLEKLGFHVAAFGCGACIGNSGPLAPGVEEEVRARHLVVASVLSGNRNFEGRIHPRVRANYLCAPPLVVAYALAGTVLRDLSGEPVGHDPAGRPVFLRELWPAPEAVEQALRAAQCADDYARVYGGAGALNPAWNELPEVTGEVYAWDGASTYIREPPFLVESGAAPDQPADLADAAVLALFGDFITTDHISPAGRIAPDSPAARYLMEHGVAPADFNTYGARRGNHEVMMRGTFAHGHLRNRLAAREGGWTRHEPDGAEMSIFDTALRYRDEGRPVVVLAGAMYGAGSSRDWAAKGPALLGVRAVIAESFERIHRSNLVRMGVLPLEFMDGVTAAGLGFTGRERITLRGWADNARPGGRLTLEAVDPESGRRIEAILRVRVDTPLEADYYRQGGILPYVLRTLMQKRGGGGKDRS